MDTIKKVAPAPGSSPNRKAYKPPVLSQYGDVRRLTGGGGGNGVEGAGAGPMTMVCWIAESLYGVDTPRVLLVRAWLARCLERRDGWALVVVPLYSRFGRRVAAAIRVFPAMKRIFRPVFDRAVRRAFHEYSARAVAQRDFA